MVIKEQKKEIVKEIDFPDNVSVAFQNNLLVIKGPKGEVARNVSQHELEVKIEGNKVIIQAKRADRNSKKMSGSLEAHVKNMIRGSQQKHNYTLKICSGHFPMNVSVSSGKLMIKNFLGEKVPRVLELKQGAEVKIEGDLIHVSSPSKEIAGQVSADIEQLTRRPGFDTRVFQDGIYMIKNL